ncbi:MAG: hypothetical protein NT025_04640 [bacterium]|nr:hypothetical protein [bacterium]
MCTLAILTALILAPVVTGQVSIIPLIQEISVNPGGKTQFDLRIGNRSEQTMAFSMHGSNLDISQEGIPSPLAEQTDWSCAEWITFTPSDFELQTDSVQTVQGLISAPVGVVGGHYAFITCQYRISAEPTGFVPGKEARAQIEFGRAVSSTLLVTVRSSKNDVQLRPDSLLLVSGQGERPALTLDRSAAGGPNVWQVTVPVTNTGNLHTVATGQVSIWTEDLRLVERADLLAGKGFVLPRKSRLFKAQGTRPLDDGTYMVRVALRSREGKFTGGSFPFYIVQGTPTSDVPTETIRDIMEAFTPKFGLSKNLLDFAVTPNARRTGGIRLTNYSQDTLSIIARPVTWTMDDIGKVVLEPDPSQLINPCVSWLDVSPNPIVILPKSGAMAKVTVAAPEEVEGEYYAAIVFETGEMRKDLPAELQLGRTALIMVASATGLVRKATIEVTAYKPISPLMRTFTINVVNAGNVHCFASGKLTILDKNWKAVLEPITFGGPQDYLLPGKSYTYVAPCAGALERGRYSAVVEVEYSEEARSEVTEYYFDAK